MEHGQERQMEWGVKQQVIKCDDSTLHAAAPAGSGSQPGPGMV